MSKLKAIIVDEKKSLILQIRCNALSQQASLLGQKVNFTNFTAVYTGTTEIKWDDKTTETIYTDVGFSGYALLAIVYFLTSGEPAQAPETFPQPVPAQ